MMKFIAILLSNLILLQSLNIGMESFTKIKVLLEHVEYHQEQYGDTFFDFLVEHYGDNNDLVTITNHKEHKDLPFKKVSLTYNHLISDFNFNLIIFELKNKVILNSKSNYYYQESYSHFEKSSVFQPPKHT